MPESVDNERWREPKMGLCDTYSIRKGTLQPSHKYKPMIAVKMNDSYWRMGIDKQTEYKVRRRGEGGGENRSKVGLFRDVDERKLWCKVEINN